MIGWMRQVHCHPMVIERKVSKDALAFLAILRSYYEDSVGVKKLMKAGEEVFVVSANTVTCLTAHAGSSASYADLSRELEQAGFISTKTALFADQVTFLQPVPVTPIMKDKKSKAGQAGRAVMPKSRDARTVKAGDES